MANTPAATSSKVIPHPFGNFSNDLTKKGLDMSKSLNKIKATIIYLNSKGIYKIETIKPATSSITTSFGSLLLKYLIAQFELYTDKIIINIVVNKKVCGSIFK